MKRDRAKELLPIIQAYAEGKKIQLLHKHGGDWEDLDSHAGFEDESVAWRIKPEPEVIYVNKLSNFGGNKASIYYSELDANKAAPLGSGNDYEYIAKKFIACE